MGSIELAKISRSSHSNEIHMEKNTEFAGENTFKNQKTADRNLLYTNLKV